MECSHALASSCDCRPSYSVHLVHCLDPANTLLPSKQAVEDGCIRQPTLTRACTLLILILCVLLLDISRCVACRRCLRLRSRRQISARRPRTSSPAYSP
jgi:hypothetical protein